jgi:hypothetical protein
MRRELEQAAVAQVRLVDAFRRLYPAFPDERPLEPIRAEAEHRSSLA